MAQRYVHATRGLLRQFLLLLLLLAAQSPVPVAAIGSTNFSIEEDFLGGGGSINSTSASYSSADSIGAAAIGAGAATAYQAISGATTTNDPGLTVAVDTSSVAFGSLSVSATKTGTATFSVANYTSSGYIAQVVGAAPTNGAHQLTPMSSPASSAVGTEQFGINLVANTSPATFGADPQQIPDNTFSFGAAATNYATANTFKYATGDTISQSIKSSGRTTYTISYIANIAPSTPAGSYVATHEILVTGTY